MQYNVRFLRIVKWMNYILLWEIDTQNRGIRHQEISQIHWRSNEVLCGILGRCTMHERWLCKKPRRCLVRRRIRAKICFRWWGNTLIAGSVQFFLLGGMIARWLDTKMFIHVGGDYKLTPEQTKVCFNERGVELQEGFYTVLASRYLRKENHQAHIRTCDYEGVHSFVVMSHRKTTEGSVGSDGRVKKMIRLAISRQRWDSWNRGIHGEWWRVRQLAEVMATMWGNGWRPTTDKMRHDHLLTSLSKAVKWGTTAHCITSTYKTHPLNRAIKVIKNPNNPSQCSIHSFQTQSRRHTGPPACHPLRSLQAQRQLQHPWTKTRAWTLLQAGTWDRWALCRLARGRLAEWWIRRFGLW